MILSEMGMGEYFRIYKQSLHFSPVQIRTETVWEVVERGRTVCIIEPVGARGQRTISSQAQVKRYDFGNAMP